MQKGSWRVRASAAAAILAAVATAGPARAQTPEDPPPPVPVAPAPPSTGAGYSWYGYQLLMTDAFATMTLLGAAGAGNGGVSGALAALGGVAYVGSGVVVHGVHHHPGSAVASIVLRVGLPFLGGLIGILVGGAQAAKANPVGANSVESASWEVLDGAVGFGAGVLAAVVVDDVFLSFERNPGREAPAPVAPAPTKSAFSVAPYAGAAPGARGEAQAALGVTGRF